MDHNYKKFLKTCEYQTTIYVSWETYMKVKKLNEGHRIEYETTDWLKIGEGVHQGCILSPCLFNLHAEYIMWTARLDEAQAGIKIVGRNINNFRYADDTTLMAESKEELESLNESERGEWKSWLQTQHSEK